MTVEYLEIAQQDLQVRILPGRLSPGGTGERYSPYPRCFVAAYRRFEKLTA
jgi:hypothetical protein